MSHLSNYQEEFLAKHLFGVASLSTYTVGQMVSFRARFEFEGKYLTATQLGPLVIHIRKPDATLLEISTGITAQSDGSFRCNWSSAGMPAGIYRYYWQATGEYGSIGEGSFTLKSAPF